MLLDKIRFQWWINGFSWVLNLLSVNLIYTKRLIYMSVITVFFLSCRITGHFLQKPKFSVHKIFYTEYETKISYTKYNTLLCIKYGWMYSIPIRSCQILWWFQMENWKINIKQNTSIFDSYLKYLLTKGILHKERIQLIMWFSF